MMLMNMEILGEFSASTDHVIVRRKRSKRSRPSSSASSTSCVASHGSLASSSPGAATSSTCTEADQDMANCLILLARGGAAACFSPVKRVDDGSSKFAQVNAAGGKAGVCVYECKTCGRSFPSFQALGGHRASHKKPKPKPLLTAVESVDRINQKKSSPPPSDDQKEAVEGTGFTKFNATISPPPILTRRPENKPKFHECSLCGSEFGSGQALGGHMRKHRSETTTMSNPPASEKTGNLLELDLNLPAAPEEDDDDDDNRRSSEFDLFKTSSQQPSLVFGAPAPLVDCHY